MITILLFLIFNQKRLSVSFLLSHVSSMKSGTIDLIDIFWLETMRELNHVTLIDKAAVLCTVSKQSLKIFELNSSFSLHRRGLGTGTGLGPAQ